MKIHFQESAKEDRRRILTHTYREFGRAKATELRRAFRFELLTNNPKAGRPGRKTNTREQAITGTPFIAVYRVQTRRRRIEIVRLLLGAKQWPAQ